MCVRGREAVLSSLIPVRSAESRCLRALRPGTLRKLPRVFLRENIKYINKRIFLEQFALMIFSFFNFTLAYFVFIKNF